MTTTLPDLRPIPARADVLGVDMFVKRLTVGERLDLIGHVKAHGPVSAAALYQLCISPDLGGYTQEMIDAAAERAAHLNGLRGKVKPAPHAAPEAGTDPRLRTLSPRPGVCVVIRPLKVGELDSAKRIKTEAGAFAFHVRLAALALCDGDGEPLFTNDDDVNDCDAVLIQRVGLAVAARYGIR